MKIAANEVSFNQSSRMVSTQLIFDGVILQTYLNQVRLDQGQVVERELIHKKPAVAILAVTPEDKALLVKQYRAAIDSDTYEIPAGILDKGDQDEPLEGAKRELEEETTYQAAHWQNLGDFYASPGFLDEKLTLYYAHGLVSVENPLPQDDDEGIELFEMTRQQVQDLLDQGQIIDLKTLYALQLWLGGGGLHA